MKVSQLAQFLDGLAAGLNGITATFATDLRTMNAALGPFAERTVADFTKFLTACEEYQRTGIVPGKGAARGRASAAKKEAPSPA